MMQLFKQGYSYLVGVDRPMVVSLDTLKEGVEDEGFSVGNIWECEQAPPMPAPVPGTCGDEWDYIVAAKRVAPSAKLDIPGRVKWILELPPPKPAVQPPPVQPPPGAPVQPPPPEPPQLIHVAQFEAEVPLGPRLVAVAIGAAAGWAALSWLGG